MVTAAGVNAVRQAVRGAIESVRAERQTSQVAMSPEEAGKWLRGGARFTLLCQRQLLTVSTLLYSQGTVCVCKREKERACLGRNVTVDHLFCLET